MGSGKSSRSRAVDMPAQNWGGGRRTGGRPQGCEPAARSLLVVLVALPGPVAQLLELETQPVRFDLALGDAGLAVELLADVLGQRRHDANGVPTRHGVRAKAEEDAGV
eukprot:GHVR01189886.1.p2 GENE.GHVR01189886.1~~GHVR01189886.1.p2  ORF type:complete len:108 (+),score=16.81 GHVR01189886.1:67-390(+)